MVFDTPPRSSEFEPVLTVDFSKCQMKDFLKAVQEGKKIDIETFSPYLGDYNNVTGEIWESALTNADAIGLALAKMMRETFPTTRMVSLYDEYNSNRSDAHDEWGRPAAGKQRPFDEKTKAAFHTSLVRLLEETGVIAPNDHEGDQYLLISESEKIRDAEKLVEQLQHEGYIKKGEGEELFFQNPNAENFHYQTIALRTKNGRWLCEALDAASFLNEENRAIVHMVVLPMYFKEQQDKVWEILRVLGIQPTSYHNIFFDDQKSTPDGVVHAVQEAIEREKKK